MPKSVPDLDNLYENVKLPCALVAECRYCVWWVEQWWCSGRTPSSCRSTPSSSSRWSPPWQTPGTCSGPPHKSCFPPRWVSSLACEGLWRPSRMFDLQKFMVTLIWNKSSFVFVHTDIIFVMAHTTSEKRLKVAIVTFIMINNWWATDERLMSDWWVTDEWLMSNRWATD